MALAIHVHDGLRHANPSGYGMLSRSLVLGLAARGHDVRLQAGTRFWAVLENGARESLEALPQERNSAWADVVLQVATPGGCRAFDQPTAIYTQNALGGLRPDWITALHQADAVIVPGEFDRQVFAKDHKRVYVAPQSSSPSTYKPYPRWRADGPSEYTFMFVGSYSYRKGVDLLLQAFLEEFAHDEPVRLVLRTPGVGRGTEFNHLLRALQATRPLARVDLHGDALSPEWMCRAYNMVDCVITLSRGEGWCMPLSESLLCGIPVIAPKSTGMAVYLDGASSLQIPTDECDVLAIVDDFGGGFRNAYGHPGITYYEPRVGDAKAAMREAFTYPMAHRARAAVGRDRILNEFSWTRSVLDVEAALQDLLRSTNAKPIAPSEVVL